jgi:hypothetical protein
MADPVPPVSQIPALPVSSPFATMLSDSADSADEEESSNPWPAPVTTDSEGDDEKGAAQNFPTIVSLPTPLPVLIPEEKPTWRSDAWEMLLGIESEDQRIGHLKPVSPETFRIKCESDVHAIDLHCSRPDENDEINQVVGGVMWSDEVITLSVAYSRKFRSQEETHLHNLKRMLDCIPNGCGLTTHTKSELLVTEGEKFRGWVESGQIQEIQGVMHEDWRNILGGMELQGKLLGFELWQSGRYQQQEAALLRHCQERIEKVELRAREGTLEDDPGEPPYP